MDALTGGAMGRLVGAVDKLRVGNISVIGFGHSVVAQSAVTVELPVEHYLVDVGEVTGILGLLSGKSLSGGLSRKSRHGRVAIQGGVIWELVETGAFGRELSEMGQQRLVLLVVRVPLLQSAH
jgi:hypothetical protein